MTAVLKALGCDETLDLGSLGVGLLAFALGLHLSPDNVLADLSYTVRFNVVVFCLLQQQKEDIKERGFCRSLGLLPTNNTTNRKTGRPLGRDAYYRATGSAHTLPRSRVSIMTILIRGIKPRIKEKLYFRSTGEDESVCAFFVFVSGERRRLIEPRLASSRARKHHIHRLPWRGQRTCGSWWPAWGRDASGGQHR